MLPSLGLILSPAALHDHGSDGWFADAFAVLPPAAGRGWSERGPAGCGRQGGHGGEGWKTTRRRSRTRWIQRSTPHSLFWSSNTVHNFPKHDWRSKNLRNGVKDGRQSNTCYQHFNMSVFWVPWWRPSCQKVGMLLSCSIATSMYLSFFEPVL